MPTRRSVTALIAASLAGLCLPGFGHAAADEADAFSRKLAEVETRLGARLGAFIHDLESDRKWMRRAEERFAMCSTFKFLACGAVLASVDAGEEDLARQIAFTDEDLVTYSPVTEAHADGAGMTLGALCEAAMTRSDNTAANLILQSLGGPAAVTAFARSIGDTTTRLDRFETALNEASPGDPRDTTSPQAIAHDLQVLLARESLSEASRKQLRDWMLANKTGDAKLRAGVPSDWQVGDKTGGGGHGTTNDIAILWPSTDRKPIVAAIYLTETVASLDDRNAGIAEIGKALSQSLGGRKAFSG
ncbi:class A beta-lactamase [Afifella sp. IM 167]|uniref:class A beta-lactamase n=1 Tax=Afifella sp. IM 167 TaxID=2033586 RepID=UPI00351D5AF8